MKKFIKTEILSNFYKKNKNKHQFLDKIKNYCKLFKVIKVFSNTNQVKIKLLGNNSIH